MRIAVVGNRVGWSRDYVFAVLQREGVNKNDIIISGGADGVDTYAQEFAKKIGAQMRIIYPDVDLPSPQRYFDRNEKIADMCEKMIAFDKESTHSGTKNAITHAQKFDKDLVIIEDEFDKVDKTDKKDTVTKRTKKK